MYINQREDNEISRVLNKAMQAFDEGTNYPGMSYEQGIMDAIQWIVGETGDEPLEEIEV